MSKPILLFCRQYSAGIGRLMRCLELARSLGRQYRVAVLNCGPLPDGISAPVDVDVVQMRACVHEQPGRSTICDHSSEGCRKVAAERREFILQQYVKLKPAVVIIDTFPFGRGGSKDEWQPMLGLASGSTGNKPLILCSLQDICGRNGRNLQSEHDQTAQMLEFYFDAVLVHSDPVFVRLEEFFQPQKALATPAVYTGFLSPGQSTVVPTEVREKRILVSAGGGESGGSLFRVAIEAHRILWEAERLPMTIITGPLFPKREWQELQWLTRKSQALTIKRSVPNLRAEMIKVRWSVSQCGYSTAIEVIGSGVAPLFVPSPTERYIAQIDRACRLVDRGAGRLLVKSHLNAASLAHEMMQLIRFVPRETSFDMSGSVTTIRLIEQMTMQHSIDFPVKAMIER